MEWSGEYSGMDSHGAKIVVSGSCIGLLKDVKLSDVPVALLPLDFQFEWLSKQVIPIYTNKSLHPTKKRPDCPMEKDYKLGLRRLMLKELEEGKIPTSEIVKKYELKVNML